MTPAFLAELRALAEAATPGPWEHGGEDAPWNVLAPHTPEEYAIVSTSGLYADARYLAAVSPDVVLWLLDALEAERVDSDRLAEALDGPMRALVEGEATPCQPLHSGPSREAMGRCLKCAAVDAIGAALAAHRSRP